MVYWDIPWPCTDIVGEIIAVKSNVSDTPGEKSRLMATIKLDKYTYFFFYCLDEFPCVPTVFYMIFIDVKYIITGIQPSL